MSNNDDLGVVIKEIGLLSEDIKNLQYKTNLLEERLKKGVIFSNIQIPLVAACGVVSGVGIGMLINKEDNGKYLLTSGLIGIGVIEITYNAGHWVFKWW